MKKKELGITKGNVSVIADTTYPSLHQIWSNIGDKETFPTYIAKTCYAIQSEQNANLIADAFNTANKCGLLPSELLEQRVELLDALEKVKSELCAASEKYRFDSEYYKLADDIINQIER